MRKAAFTLTCCLTALAACQVREAEPSAMAMALYQAKLDALISVVAADRFCTDAASTVSEAYFNYDSAESRLDRLMSIHQASESVHQYRVLCPALTEAVLKDAYMMGFGVTDAPQGATLDSARAALTDSIKALCAAKPASCAAVDSLSKEKIGRSGGTEG